MYILFVRCSVYGGRKTKVSVYLALFAIEHVSHVMKCITYYIL